MEILQHQDHWRPLGAAQQHGAYGVKQLQLIQAIAAVTADLFGPLDPRK
jgi:hypothetical protein